MVEKRFISVADFPIIDWDMDDLRQGLKDLKIREAVKRTGPYPKQPKEDGDE